MHQTDVVVERVESPLETLHTRMIVNRARRWLANSVMSHSHCIQSLVMSAILCYILATNTIDEEAPWIQRVNVH